MKIPFLLAATMLIPAFIACSSQKKNAESASDSSSEPVVQQIVHPRKPNPISYIPKATAFKMNGDYADNVAITLNENGSIAYYPAPSDITESSRPIDLGNGWWLNRQGISDRSVFTRFTFDEYSKLKKAPSAKELKESVIPGSCITIMQELPFNINEAQNHIDSLRNYVKEVHRKPSIMRPIE